MKGICKRVIASIVALVMTLSVGLGVSNVVDIGSMDVSAASTSIPVKNAAISNLTLNVGTNFSVNAYDWQHIAMYNVNENNRYQVISATSSKNSGLLVQWKATLRGYNNNIIGCDNYIQAKKAGNYQIKVRIMDKQNKNAKTDYVIKVKVVNRPSKPYVAYYKYDVKYSEKNNMATLTAHLYRGTQESDIFPIQFGYYKRIISISNKNVMNAYITKKDCIGDGIPVPVFKIDIKKTGTCVVKVETTSGTILNLTFNCKK